MEQNIMEANRLHFYKILTNERRMPRRVVPVIFEVKDGPYAPLAPEDMQG